LLRLFISCKMQKNMVIAITLFPLVGKY
jgi:hypothetical protein